MEGDRAADAMSRIETALARIDAAAARITPTNPNVLSLINRHEALREEVAATLRELDRVIAELQP